MVVPVTVYVVVAVGVAVTDVPVVADKPVPGAQTYVSAPLAVRTEFPPEQMVGFAGVIVITGFGFTVKVMVDVPVHPFPSVPVTV
jgi:hypothetical protein